MPRRCDHCGDAFAGTDRIHILDADLALVAEQPWQRGACADWVHASCFDAFRASDGASSTTTNDQPTTG